MRNHNDFYVYHVLLENGKLLDDTADSYDECCAKANVLSYQNQSQIVSFISHRNDMINSNSGIKLPQQMKGLK